MTAPTRELRQQVPAEVMDWLDGMAEARNLTKTDLVNAILQREVSEFHRIQTIVARYERSNGSGRMESE